MILETLRAEVLKTAMLLPKYGLVWMAGGTVCARDENSGFIVVTPSGMDYQDLTPADMVVTDSNLQPVEGSLRPSIALRLWVNFLRPDIHAVIHTHSPCATALSILNEPLPVVTETMADWFGMPVPVSPYLHVEDPAFSTLPVDVMGDGYAVLLGNHGPITIGKNLKHALERAVTLEEAAHSYTIARSIGKPAPLTLDQAAASFEYYHHRYGQPKQK